MYIKGNTSLTRNNEEKKRLMNNVSGFMVGRVKVNLNKLIYRGKNICNIKDFNKVSKT